MAETVKKSRIVSDTDDNLEEALMEEFNMRLKSCMSQDDLQNSDDQEQQQYDNVAIITKTNGTVNQDFIKAEQENYYEEPFQISNGETAKQTTNGHQEEELIYENLPPQQDAITIIEPANEKPEGDHQYVEMTTPPSLILDSPPDNYEIVEAVPELYEPVVNNRPDLTLTDLSEVKTDASEVKSVKDRMLLSTDVQPCLLFTQTVTSPMLTPSEENIDFLKGFQTSETNDNQVITTDMDDDAVVDNSENVYENSVFLKTNGEEVEEEEEEKEKENNEVIYENLKKDNIPLIAEESIYENLKDLGGGDEIIYQNLEELKKEEERKKMNEILDTVDNIIDVTTSELKSVDIMKQIGKFEGDDSTQVTETYVETTIESNSMSDKGLKKKKSKKSRKEEKENISVSETITNQDESYYNVDVKSLCRSFGDLTKLEDKNNKNCKDRTRTKSLSEAKSPYNNKIENVFLGVSVRTLREKFHLTNNLDSNCRVGVVKKNHMKIEELKSSFNKFDALQKKNVLHVRSSDSSKAQEKFNGAQVEASNCKACDKAVFQMEQIKAERAVWHKNCFRCAECNKQINVDTYQSHEGTLYCKPHFKALFAPKVIEDEAPPRPRKPELIIRENQPLELPPDVIRASDKPDLGLEELQSLNVKERFQVFEHHQSETSEIERNQAVNVKRSPSILSKLAKFQSKGMDIGVADDSLNGIPIEESSSEEEQEREEADPDDADLVRAKKVQKEKPFHFTGMTDVKNKWEHQTEQNATRDERREERKQEIQTIRSKLFMGKQGKMKEAYQQAVMVSESSTNLKFKEPIEICDTRSIKEKFEKGEVMKEAQEAREDEDTEVFESEISKNSRSLFLELDANAAKHPQITAAPAPKLDVKKAREAYMVKASSEDVVKSSIEQVDEVQVKTADIQERFKFFETYRQPEKERRAFRITPPREGQAKAPTPDREVYRDPEVVRSEEFIEDSVVAKESHTATKMLNKFRQMEENLTREPQPSGPKPLKRFTPPPEPARQESHSEGDSGSEEESEEEDENDRGKAPDEDLLEAQKAARAKQLRAKFERWEANEIKREQNNTTVNIIEEMGEDQSQIESTKSLRARFESMRESSTDTNRQPRVKVNRFV